jgi:hypothetical protein
MPHESSQTELARLLTEQETARRDEVFGGLSPAERAEYARKAKRINDLEIELRTSTVVKKSFPSVRAEQSRQWDRTSETDTPQAEAHQPYRSRETGSTDANTESSGSNRSKEKNEPEEKGDE